MRFTGKLRYPHWVNKDFLIIGDVCYRRKDEQSDWKKMLYNGNSWIPWNIAIPQLTQKSEIRQAAMNHNKLVRETGRY